LTTRAEIVYILAQKYFRVCHLVLPLVGRVRKERNVSRALDRFRQHALVRCTGAGDSSWQDLPAFRQIILKQPHVLEIDKVYFVDTEPANAPAVHTATTAAAAAHWPSIAVVIGIVTTATTALAVFIIGCHYIYPLQRFHSPEANLFAGSFGKLHRWSTTPVLTRRGTLRSFTSATILQLVRTPAIFIHAHRDVAQHAIVNAHAAFKLGNLLARALDLDQHKRTVFVVQDFISELALAHRLGLGHHTALIGNDLREALGEFRHVIIGRRVYYEDHFVLSLCIQLKPPVHSPNSIKLAHRFQSAVPDNRSYRVCTLRDRLLEDCSLTA